MTSENENKVPQEHKIHETHFPVVKIPLKETDQKSRFEWVDVGNGHWKRVPKSTEEKGNREILNPSEL